MERHDLLIRLSLVLVCLLCAGCGSSAASPHPTPTAKASREGHGQFADRTTGISITVLRALPRANYGLFKIRMRNTSSAPYISPDAVPFRDSAVAGPLSRGTSGACDADESQGTGLSYLSIGPRQAHTGWIRCDYPHGTQVMFLAWYTHQVGIYRIRG